MTDRPAGPDWTSPQRSQSNGGECVQHAPKYARATGDYLVRDSKDPEGPHLTLTADQWAGLVAFAKNHG
ncbi:DUF397 domain-containing protein [Streptomyces subrutilus]|uniref:DUF397 domain-containing protein n=1 Tax=Streptomyces subrutilus TaxID=36818 RepID=UPI00340BE69B